MRNPWPACCGAACYDSFMPIDIDDARTLSTAALALGRELADALSPDGDGGRKVTPAEGRKIMRLTSELLMTLIRDLLD